MSVPELTCVLNGLRLRTLGRYGHDSDHAFTTGSSGVRHLLLVGTNDRVKYARVLYDRHAGGEDLRFEKASLCRLKQPSYFEDCILRLSAPMSDAAWACGLGIGSGATPSELAWFEECTEQSPPTCDWSALESSLSSLFAARGDVDSRARGAQAVWSSTLRSFSSSGPGRSGS
jgi:hypothetical protein